MELSQQAAALADPRYDYVDDLDPVAPANELGSAFSSPDGSPVSLSQERTTNERNKRRGPIAFVLDILMIRCNYNARGDSDSIRLYSIHTTSSFSGFAAEFEF